MTMEPKDTTVLVYDNGHNIEVAIRLSKDCKRVLYYTSWSQGGFPERNLYEIGRNIPGIERVENFWESVDDADVVMFTDIYTADIQDYLRKQGKKVWGGVYGEELELHRDKLKELLDAIGMDVNEYKIVKGVTALEKELEKEDDVFVKLSMFRGLSESKHWLGKDLTNHWLLDVKHKLGALGEQQEFVIEKPIESKVEAGIDTYCIDGKQPTIVMAGLEIKDQLYGARMVKYDTLPNEIKGINDKLLPILADFSYRQFISTEVRITKDKAYLIDITTRCPEPPGPLHQLMWKNYSQIIISGANGEVIDPLFDEEYGVEIIMKSDNAEKNFQPIMFPEKYRDNIKLKNFTIIDGTYYVIPIPLELQEIGSVVATGNSLDDAMNNAKSIIGGIKGDGLEFHVEKFDGELKEEIAEMGKMGLDFFGEK